VDARFELLDNCGGMAVADDVLYATPAESSLVSVISLRTGEELWYHEEERRYHHQVVLSADADGVVVAQGDRMTAGWCASRPTDRRSYRSW
jgi:hypothetical protein